MRFYAFDEQFYKDAKSSELSMANVSSKIATLKAAYIGSKLSIARLCVALLPLLSLLLPAANATFRLPFAEKEIALSALGIFGAFSDGTLEYLLGLCSFRVFGKACTALMLSIGAELFCAVMAFFVFLFTLLSFCSIKKMARLLCVISGLGLVSSGAVAVLFTRFCKIAGQNTDVVLTGKISFGCIVTAAVFAAVFAINFLIAKNGIKIEYAEGVPERLEIYKKVRRGELKIDELPYPIVETAETRAIDEEVAKEQQQFKAKETQEV